MNIMKKTRPKIALKLWMMMMALVSLAIFFIWAALIFFFERNYAQATLNESRTRLRPVVESLQDQTLTNYDYFLPLISCLAQGNVFLLDSESDIVQIYSYGHAVDLESYFEKNLIYDILQNDAHEYIQNGDTYETIHYEKENMFPFSTKLVRIDTGFPVVYEHFDSYIIISQVLDLETTLKLNRKILILLSLLLSILSAALAAIFSRHFTKPIYQIIHSVDQLTKNDFTPIPPFKRKDELGELSISVAQLSQSLQKVDRLGKELIANVSHELRSPLAIISGYAELVRDIDWKDELQREEDLNLIIQEANHLAEMVTDILDYSQLQANGITLHLLPLNLYELAKSEQSRCIPLAAKHFISIQLQASSKDLLILADESKITQVIRNLLYNAINHTPEHGIVTLWISKHENHIRFSVCNPGEPIPEEDQELIWERYKQSQHLSGRTLGTGIGLSIVKTILIAHEMTYGVEYKNGHTIFWFETRLH